MRRHDPLKPPLSYFGGKTILAPRIARLLPAHRHYVEPYAGSLAVLLAKRPSVMETVNDLDGDLMHFWRMLRDRPGELIRTCALTPHSRTEHEQAYNRGGCDDLERARRIWVCLTQGRAGQLQKTGWRHYLDPAGSSIGMPGYLAGYVDRMAPVVERLAHVSLECRPALDLIGGVAPHPDVCLYVDPPYLGSARSFDGDPRNGTHRYTHEMLGEQDHRDLAAALRACRAAVVLSGYASPLYDQLYAGWHRLETTASTGQGGTWGTRVEVLWSNHALDAQQGLWDEEPA